MLFRSIGGPSTVTISNSNNPVAIISGLKAGDYYFQLTVDDGKDVDFDIVRLVSEFNTQIQTLVDKKLLVYPNPSEDILYFSGIEISTIDSVQIFDMKGNMMMNTPLNKNYISIEGIPQGTYFVRFFTRKKHISSTIFIKK